MKVFLIVSVAILLCLGGCSQEKKQGKKEKVEGLTQVKNADVIQIDIPEGDLLQKLNLSSLIDSVWHVKLQSNEQCLFGAIDQLIVYDNSIFILDASNTKSLFEFTLDGKFVRKLGKLGKGPGEYIRPMSIAIDQYKKEILLFDDKLGRILFFSRDGNLARTQKLDFRTREICVFDSTTLFLNNRKASNSDAFAAVGSHYLTTMDFNGKVLSKALPYDEETAGFRYHSTQDFFKSEKEILYHPALSDTIYSISPSAISPKYVVNVGSKRLPSGYDKNIAFKQFQTKFIGEDKPFAYFLGDYYEVGDKLFFTISHKRSVVKCIYSLKTNKLTYGSMLYNDLEIDLGSFSPVGSYKNFLVTPVDPDVILKKGKSTNALVNNIITKTSLSDNPVLAFQRLKDF